MMKAYAVETHYDISGNTLTQVVEFDESTAFPVVADPTEHLNKTKTKAKAKKVRDQYKGNTAAIVVLR